MFRHRGKSRTLLHNLQLASLLSFVAGMVNVTGLFALQRLTTHVTGHYAYFAQALASRHFSSALLYVGYLLAFLFGSFCASLLVEVMVRKNVRYVYTLPVGMETCLLVGIAFLSPSMLLAHQDGIACVLLFAMGLQNALVTSLSNAVVRTTHLTGLFTDLGIELAGLLFYHQEVHRKRLYSSLNLRLTIIGFFFLGGLLGGLGYLAYGIKILLLAAFTLILAVLYDSIKFRMLALKRKYRSQGFPPLL